MRTSMGELEPLLDAQNGRACDTLTPIGDIGIGPPMGYIPAMVRYCFFGFGELRISHLRLRYARHFELIGISGSSWPTRYIFEEISTASIFALYRFSRFTYSQLYDTISI